MKILETYYLKLIAFTKLIYFLLFEMKKVKKAEVIFFFPFYHTGGAEKIHLNIVKALKEANKYVFFTQQSSSSHYKSLFDKTSDNFEIYDFSHRNYFIRNLFIKHLVKNINNNKSVITVFGSNTDFFYQILPKLNPFINRIDLIHAFSAPDYGIEQFSLPYVSYLNNRVVINNKTTEDFKELYLKNNIQNYLENIVKIENGVFIGSKAIKKRPLKFTVLFVGRWSKEKRPELFLKIAKEVLLKTDKIEFVMIGSEMEQHKNQIQEAGVTYIGEIVDTEKLNTFYENANILLITSYREGFPVVVMEAMAQGVVPIVTNVGGLCEHIQDGFNGFLINNDNEEALIIKFAAQIIALYLENSNWNRISNNALSYAHANFDIHNFNNNYKSLLLKSQAQI